MRKSQYVDDYMREAVERLRRGEKPVTPGTFLTGRLRGKAADWISRYIKSLENSLVRSRWRPGESAKGSIAYYPPDVGLLARARRTGEGS
jgi:hypothetical protein